MAETAATHASRGHRTICLPIPEPTSQRIIDDPRAFRRTLDDCFQRMPELFPRHFPGYQLMGHRVSVKQGVTIRRVRLTDGATYSIRPAFLMPYMTARTAEVQGPLSLRKFGVPFWALARVFGKPPMAWYRLECALGRFSVVGTTVRQADLPEPPWPTNTTQRATARRSPSPRPSAPVASWESSRRRGPGPTT